MVFSAILIVTGIVGVSVFVIMSKYFSLRRTFSENSGLLYIIYDHGYNDDDPTPVKFRGRA